MMTRMMRFVIVPSLLHLLGLPFLSNSNHNGGVTEAVEMAVTATKYTCDYATDSCPYAFDFVCDAAPFSTYCEANSDCFDCSYQTDPCRLYDFTSCQECTSVSFTTAVAAVGLEDTATNNSSGEKNASSTPTPTTTPITANCLWCSVDATCSSVPLEPDMLAQANKIATCQASDYVGECTTSSDETQFYPNPLNDAQSWVYRLIDVEPVWRRGITGAGVRIRFNDDGVDPSVFVGADDGTGNGKFDVSASCSIYEYTYDDYHGTACAAIAAASSSQACSVGIAPNAVMSACRTSGDDESTLTPEHQDGQFISYKLRKMDISSNSWGVDACARLERDNGHGDDIWGDLGGDGDGDDFYVDDDYVFNVTGLRQRRRRRRQRRRKLRRLTAECPFLPDSEPCSLTSSCSTMDWSYPEDNLSSACEAIIVDYCSVTLNYERDAVGCSEFLDLFVDCRYNSLTDGEHASLIRGITQGRNGKGIIYVFSGPNSYQLGQDINAEGWMNTRFTIVVAGVGKAGLHASYSTTGAAVFVSAPGGDEEYLRNFVVAQSSDSDGDMKCADAGFGTSYATPVVSGVVALMLEVNPYLGWRDVQGILASTSSMTAMEAMETKTTNNNSNNNESMTTPPSSLWTTNSAGFNHSYHYGFGIVNANAAVSAAAVDKWRLFSMEKQVIADSGVLDLPIRDHVDDVDGVAVNGNNVAESAAATTASILTIQPPVDSFVTESVVVYLDVLHPSRGDLEVILESPGGTRSLLHPGRRPESTFTRQQQQPGDAEERWKFLTVRNWGEEAEGNWTLTIVDRRRGYLKDCADVPDFTCTDNEDAVGESDFNLFDCLDFEFEEWCVNGDIGPEWPLHLGDLTICKSLSSSSPSSATTTITTPDQACCVCGGGVHPSTIPSTFVGWKLVVYGRDASLDTLAVRTGTTSPSPTTTPTTDEEYSKSPRTEGPTAATSSALVSFLQPTGRWFRFMVGAAAGLALL